LATIESIGASIGSTRIEGSKRYGWEVEKLLSSLAIKFFDKRDEQDVVMMWLK